MLGPGIPDPPATPSPRGGFIVPGDTFITNVRPLHGEPVDLHIRDGRFVEIAPGLTPTPDAATINAGDRLLYSGFVDAHAHMDKSLIGLPWYRNEVGPSLLDKIENERNLRRTQEIDSYQQSSRLARRMIAAGTTHVRTFVDIDTEWKLAGLEGVARMREDLREALSIQIVAFPQSGMLVRPGTVELMEDALRNGADVVGGLDPSTIDRDPARHLDVIFALAEKYEADVDIHLHEPGDLGAFSVELIAERTRVLGWRGRVVISHALCLGGIEDNYLDRLIELLIDQDITIMSHGPSGLRPVPSVKRLSEAGVKMCTGNDGIRDAWGPLNMPDMLLRAFLISYRNNFRRDDEIEIALDMATTGGARVIGDDDYGIAPGKRADFVLVDGQTHIEAVIERPARWLVVKNGRIVAREGECAI
jgi:cytosine/adenosine deaminase-related metal-dependent hydrolase